MTPDPYPITALIAWLGDADKVNDDKWLAIMRRSLPKKMPVKIAQNHGKHEMATALNVALLNVTTEFVLVVGADDRCAPDMVDRLWSSIGTADVAYPTMHLYGEHKSVFIADLPSPWRLQDLNLCGVALIRTEALRAVGGWRDDLYEDWGLMFRLMAAGKRFVPVPDAIYHYRIHRKGLTARIAEHAEKEGLEPWKLAPGVTEETRVPILATFYAQNTRATSYVRSELPARYLPGVATRNVDLQNRYRSSAAIFEYMSDHELFRKVARTRAAIVDVDDNYISPRLVPMIRNSGLVDAEALAELWTREQPGHRRCVQMADAVIAASAELAMDYSALNKNVHLIPNMVDPSDWDALHPLRLDETLRIIWPAGRQHLPDAPLIEGAMRWASQQPNVEVVCMGLDPGWDFAYHHEPYTPSLQKYRDVLSLADIIVAPVTMNAWNRCKSDIKWLEAAMCGAAFVGSKVPIYDTVWHGTNGLLARGKRDFERHIKDLVHSQDMRLELGRNATDRVLATRNARDMQVAYMQVLATCGVGSFEDIKAEEPEMVAVA